MLHLRESQALTIGDEELKVLGLLEEMSWVLNPILQKLSYQVLLRNRLGGYRDHGKDGGIDLRLALSCLLEDILRLNLPLSLFLLQLNLVLL